MNINQIEEFLKEEKRNYYAGSERNAFLEGAHTVIQKMGLRESEIPVPSSLDKATFKDIKAVINNQRTTAIGKILTIQALIKNHEKS